jgi:hypothetical protein
VFDFIKKGGEIRLGETLATNPDLSGKRCQNLIPENREMIKFKHGKHGCNSFDSQQLYYAAHAYAHAPVWILICYKSFLFQATDQSDEG